MAEPTTAVEFPTEVPIVPVPEHVLLPGFPQPYPVFESRYMLLLSDLAKVRQDERWVAVPRMVARYGVHYTGRPEFHKIATLGRVVQARQTGNGFAEMVVMGECRVHLEEIRSDKAYRMARCTPLVDEDASSAHARLQVDRVLQASLGLMNQLGPLASDLEGILRDRSNPSRLVFRLASVLIHDPDRRMPLLEERSLERRVDLVLDAMTDLLTMAAHSPLRLKDPAAA